MVSGAVRQGCLEACCITDRFYSYDFAKKSAIGDTSEPDRLVDRLPQMPDRLGSAGGGSGRGFGGF